MQQKSYTFDDDMIDKIKELELSDKYFDFLIIENDNPVWTTFMIYGNLIKKKDIYFSDNSARVVNICKELGTFELFLSEGNHVLEWEGHMFTVNIKITKEKEIATIQLYSKDSYDMFETFIAHAKESSKQKLKCNKDKLVVKVLQTHGWKQCTSYPKRSTSSLILLDNIVENIIDDMKTFINNEETYTTYGHPFKRNYLIVGPPGSGKSSLITVAASELNMDIYFISITAGMNEKNLCGSISNINENSILVIEDIDVLCQNAITGNSSAQNSLSILTNILDGTLHKHKLITILTSANSDHLDNILVRHGRVDYTTRLTCLSKLQVKLMIENMFKETDVINLTKKIWGVLECLKLSSNTLAHFLFKYKDLKPEDISDEMCNELSCGTKTIHIQDSMNNQENMWM